MKTLKFFVILILLILTWSAKGAWAQVEKVELRVDGLACPFCSYGLEKKLKEVKGVGKVAINVDKGFATLNNKKEQSIEVEMLEPVVKDAGFTPGEISITVVGTISEADGTPMFLVSGAERQFILTKNAQLEKLRGQANALGKPSKVIGRLTHEMPTGHHGHPYTLTITEVVTP